jgi:site-specific DNA-methyltransferase (adenine-specific)
MTEDNNTTNVQLENGNPAFAKPVLCAGAVSKDGISLIHGDSLQALKSYGDNHFDIAIVDPPYGIGDKFKGGKTGKMNFNEVVEKDWDKVPPMEYWQELMRVSKNQIIWGGNYFPLPPTRCFIVWDKQISEDFSLAMAELAWTSFDKLAKIFKMPTPKDGKIHPTQKPIQLYRWLLHNYTNENDLILDTHLGSGSIAIACHQMKRKLIGYEIDADYYRKACKRFEEQTRQTALW